MPSFLPDGPAARLPVRARGDSLPQAASADVAARGAAARKRAGTADLPEYLLETFGARRTDLGDPAFAGHHRGAALFSALDHRPADSGLVRAPLQGRDAVSPLCAFQCRVDVRADQLSGPVRTHAHYAPTGLDVVRGVWRVCPVVRLHSLP